MTRMRIKIEQHTDEDKKMNNIRMRIKKWNKIWMRIKKINNTDEDKN